MVPTAVFRCDAGATIGTGHVMRCASLAGALRDRGWSCHILTLPGTRTSVAGFAPDVWDWIETESANDPSAVRRMLPNDCALLVLDSTQLGISFERAVGGAAQQCLVIDDFPNRPHDADFLLDQTLGRPSDAYRDLVPKAAVQLLGPVYALLRSVFASLRPQALAGRKQGPIRQLLVALGGAPSSGHVEHVIAGIESSGLTPQVHLVPGASTIAEKLLRRRNVVVHSHKAAIPELMTLCDAAIGAGGGTSWERCCLGLPTIIVRVAANQADVAASLAAAGAAIDLGPIASLPTSALAEALELLNQPDERTAMTARASQICDGLGAQRVAGVIAPRRAADGRPVTLRPVGAGDDRLLFEWQRIPDIRRYANDPSPPSWEQHLRWLGRRLAEPTAGPFSVIQIGNESVGALRLDTPLPSRLGLPPTPTGESYLVSILVAPQYQGRGIAAAALQAGRDLLPDGKLYAEVLAGNLASHRLFQMAGYQAVRTSLYLSEPQPS